MKEIVLNNRKNGMMVLILILILYILATIGTIFGGMELDRGGSPLLLIIGIVILSIGWLPLCGLKVLKPQEARS